MRKYRLKKRFYVIAVTTGLLITGVGIMQVDKACSKTPEPKEPVKIVETAEAASIEPAEEETTEPAEEETTEPAEELISLGEFTITHYCCENYPHICNNGDATHTATGTTPTPGRTIAVDPDIIPYGSEVIIDGNTYIAEDTGGAINENRIDIVTNTHEEALKKGIYSAEVYLVKR